MHFNNYIQFFLKNEHFVKQSIFLPQSTFGIIRCLVRPFHKIFHNQMLVHHRSSLLMLFKVKQIIIINAIGDVRPFLSSSILHKLNEKESQSQVHLISFSCHNLLIKIEVIQYWDICFFLSAIFCEKQTFFNLNFT